jgi:PadR family transcriptional regulator, regulatory protein PadR
MREALFRDVFLGFIRVHLLYHASREPIYGLDMRDELGRHGYQLSPGTLYPILHGLERAGYLRGQKLAVQGKLRKYYRITAKGRNALDKLRPRIQELVEEVLEDKPK